MLLMMSMREKSTKPRTQCLKIIRKCLIRNLARKKVEIVILVAQEVA